MGFVSLEAWIEDDELQHFYIRNAAGDPEGSSIQLDSKTSPALKILNVVVRPA